MLTTICMLRTVPQHSGCFPLHFCFKLLHRITLSQHALVLENNELGRASIVKNNNRRIGFSEANVRGLCNVGGSTKTDATLGYKIQMIRKIQACSGI